MDLASNLRAAYRILEDRVSAALQTRIGDRQRLGTVRDNGLAFMAVIGDHRNLFPAEEFELIVNNLEAMVQLLDDAEDQSIDPPTTSPPSLLHLNHTGAPGRPRIEIDPDVLSRTLALEPKTTLADILGCSSRTVRRRQQEVEDWNGILLTPRRAALSNDELDPIVSEILKEFPHYGRSMLMGAMSFNGYNVPERRIRDSINRVCGAPSRFFGSRPIHRRKYYVPAANSLWHHDGQHGLIRWKIVIHGFIDGKTRFVVGLRAHNNNRADTVLHFFKDILAVHGCPSRVRGDHGVENARVADFMEETMGPNRGSYIWGRSVHNTRIERLWYDMTEGFGRKWKEFFHVLEDCHGLEVLDPTHIWLLHWLFLPAINADALAWAEAWNSHKIQLDGERRSSPRQLFTRSSLLDGVRGLPPQEDEGPEDYTSYGVDWEAIEDPRLAAYRRENSADDRHESPPHSYPGWMNEVVCEPPERPITDEQVEKLTEELSAAIDIRSTDMNVRRVIWVKALGFFAQLIGEEETDGS